MKQMSRKFDGFQRSVDQKFDTVIKQNSQLEQRITHLEHKLHRVILTNNSFAL